MPRRTILAGKANLRRAEHCRNAQFMNDSICAGPTHKSSLPDSHVTLAQHNAHCGLHELAFLSGTRGLDALAVRN